MACYKCKTDFNFFKKEIGCEICGFSFCGKCCKKREIPSEGAGVNKQITCNQCFLKKTKNETSTANASPPLAHKKRMEALKKQSYSVDSAKHALYQSNWSDDKDKEIAERLQKLKKDRMKNMPTESEIEERIAKLKGMDPSKYKAPPIEVYRPADRRSSVEKATDLLKEITERAEIDSRIANSTDDELAARLAKLKASKFENKDEECVEKPSGTKPALVESLSNISENQVTQKPKTEEEEVKLLLEQAKSYSSSVENDVEMTEEEEADRLVEKLMASNFEEEVEELESLNDQETATSLKDESDLSEEFPWCIICAEDATLRCFGCEGDLYCLKCFKGCHDSLDIKDHRTCPFLSPKKPAL